MASSSLPELLALWIAQLAEPLHARLAWRLPTMFVGILFAQGRQTVAAWLRAANVGEEFRPFYYFLGSLGRQTRWIAGQLLRLALAHLGTGERIVVAIDDTPTKRFGPMVEGAGVHHNPTPGPADQTFVYGHVWVTLALVCQHLGWGIIGLPLLAKLYVRRKNLHSIPKSYKVRFQTKLEQAAELGQWMAAQVKSSGKRLWMLVDGFYAKRPFLRAMLQTGTVVVSRLRKDAALWSLPTPPKEKQPGRPRKYGTQRIELAKRAGQKQRWERAEVIQYGKKVRKRYKTFLATYRPAGGVIRVVLVKEPTGWVAFFCTEPQASATDILELVAERTAIEQTFHDVKEVHGTGKQQLRNYWANLAAFHLNLWTHTLTELWAWTKPHAELVDRSRSPWDQPDRRPSHADRRNALRRVCLDAEFRRTAGRTHIAPKIRSWIKTLVACAC